MSPVGSCNQICGPQGALIVQEVTEPLGHGAELLKAGVNVPMTPGQVLLFCFWVYSHHVSIHCQGAAI